MKKLIGIFGLVGVVWVFGLYGYYYKEVFDFMASHRWSSACLLGGIMLVAVAIQLYQNWPREGDKTLLAKISSATKNPNYTRIGTPVQVFTPKTKFSPGVICHIDGSKVHILELTTMTVITDIKHLDFYRPGEKDSNKGKYWRFIPQDFCGESESVTYNFEFGRYE